jgi:hypothetical protein
MTATTLPDALLADVGVGLVERVALDALGDVLELVASSTLGGHVSDVLLLRSEPEVARVDTGRVVAGVTHFEGPIKLPVVEDVGVAVSEHVVGHLVPWGSDGAVACGVFVGDPRPALVVSPSINLLPEPLLHRPSLRIHEKSLVLTDRSGKKHALGGLVGYSAAKKE